MPLHHDGKIIGVLDIDSPIKSQFTIEDEKGLAELVRVIENWIGKGEFK